MGHRWAEAEIRGREGEQEGVKDKIQVSIKLAQIIFLVPSSVLLAR